VLSVAFIFGIERVDHAGELRRVELLQGDNHRRPRLIMNRGRIGDDDNVAAMKNGTLLQPEARAEILRRIEALTPRSERRWGRMTPHQMVCHLSDACRAALGERRVPVIGTLWERTVIRCLAIHTNVKWPQGVRTVPEADQEIGGTRPTEFARDVDDLRGLIQRFSGAEAQLSGNHPLFGALSAAEWGRFSYRHADHHLRQFGA
jgi:hypothetical protein